MDLKSFYLKIFSLFLIFFISTTSGFSYDIFLISSGDNYASRGKRKTFLLEAGIPYVGILYDLKPPVKAFLLTPNKKTQKVSLLRILLPQGAFDVQRIGYKINLTPSQKGDYYLCVESDYFLDPSSHLLKVFAKTPVHVFQEKGWTNNCGFPLEIIPYTRPYGFVKHGIFWGRVYLSGKPLGNATIEVKKVSSRLLTEKELPRASNEEINFPLLKKTTRTNKEGFFVVSFEEPGWWVISVKVPAGKREYANSIYPLELEHTFSVYVFSKKIL